MLTLFILYCLSLFIKDCQGDVTQTLICTAHDDCISSPYFICLGGGGECNSGRCIYGRCISLTCSTDNQCPSEYFSKCRPFYCNAGNCDTRFCDKAGKSCNTTSGLCFTPVLEDIVEGSLPSTVDVEGWQHSFIFIYIAIVLLAMLIACCFVSHTKIAKR